METLHKKDELRGMISRLLGLLETVVLAGSYYVIWRIGYMEARVFHPYLGRGKIVLMIVYGILTYILFYLCDGFQFGHLKLIDVVISQWTAMVLVNIITWLQLSLIANVMVSFVPIIAMMGVDATLIILCCFVFATIYHRLYIPRNMLMIYGTENALELKFKLDAHTDKYRITTLLSAETELPDIIKKIKEHDAVVINDVPTQLRNDVVKYCYEQGVRTYIVPKISDIILRGAPNVSLVDTPLLLVRGGGLTPEERFFKRFFDILLSGVAMIPGAVIMAIIAVLIKLDDGGPIFYRQRRVTQYGREFEILKFRSMIVDAEKDGESIPAAEEDPRITRVGKAIRSSRLDELPQLLNILKGDMSLVGPRPERVEHVKAYTKIIPEFSDRLKVKGGLTGYAQIYGKYNTNPYDKIRLDLMYIENYSLLLDFRILLMTIRVLLKKESTEGFDRVEDLKKQKDEFLRTLPENVVKKRKS